MNNWLIGVIGVVFLGVMIDLLYPNGKTNAICKSVFGIMVIIMLIKPLFKLKDIDINTYVSTNPNIVSSINNSKADTLEIKIKNVLAEKDIIGVDVEIEPNLYNIEFEIKNIYIDITNLVLTENITNINKYEVITNEICNAIQIDKERIIIYG